MTVIRIDKKQQEILDAMEENTRREKCKYAFQLLLLSRRILAEADGDTLKNFYLLVEFDDEIAECANGNSTEFLDYLIMRVGNMRDEMIIDMYEE